MKNIETVRWTQIPDLQPLSKDERSWQLMLDWDIFINGKRYTIPRGFQTDLFSARRLANLVEPRLEWYVEASVIHDYFYDYANDLSRKEADYTFYLILRKMGMSYLRASVMYYAVRLLGGFVWGPAGESFLDRIKFW